MPPAAPLEELTPDDCLGLLATTSLGRLGVSIGALPAVLPVNFVIDGTDIVFRTVAGTKLDAATARVVVAFEADGYDPETGTGWSVLVRGVASEVTDPAEYSRLEDLPLQSWAFGDTAERFVRVGMELVTGRRVVRQPAKARVE